MATTSNLLDSSTTERKLATNDAMIFTASCSHKSVSCTTSFWTKGWSEPVVLCESCYFYHVSSNRSKSPNHNPNSGYSLLSDIHASISSVWSRSQKLTKERRIVRSIKQCDYFERPDCILPGKLYLGSQFSACHLGTLEKLGISAVLVCGNSLPRFFMEHPNSTIEYHKLPIHDSVDQPLLPYIYSAMQFLETNILHRQRSVLVHCAAGVSRSASMVIAFLMKQNRWDFDTARQFVWEKRPTINPNPRFEKELRCHWYPICVPPQEQEENLYDTLSRISSLTPSPSFADAGPISTCCSSTFIIGGTFDDKGDGADEEDSSAYADKDDEERPTEVTSASVPTISSNASTVAAL